MADVDRRCDHTGASVFPMTCPARILIMTADMGGGHNATARALEERARALWPDCEVANAAPGSRQILLDTLRCWLRNMGDQQSVAATLHVHRQTVRYRMTRLRELYGSALDDPDTRARMMLALAWEKPTSEPAPSNGTDHTDALSDRP